MRVEPVASPDGLDLFLDVPGRLRGDEPGFVAPLRAVDARDLAGLGTLARSTAVQGFLALDSNGEPLGRIAALFNPRLTDPAGASVGQLGWFESIDDVAVAGALVGAAGAWLASRGARTLWGPMNGGVHRPHRFLVRGFDRPPFLFEPRNPPHYPRLFERLGFRSIVTWRSYEFDRAVAGSLLPVFAAGERRCLGRGKYRPEPLAAAGDAATVLARLHALITSVWAGHPGFTAFDRDEFVETYAGVLAILPPGYVGVASEVGFGDVALALAYPNWVEEARGLAGDATRWAAWMTLGRPLPPEVVLHTVAIHPRARHGGVAAMVLRHGLELVVRDGYERGIIGLAIESLGRFERALDATREYALFARAAAC